MSVYRDDQAELRRLCAIPTTGPVMGSLGAQTRADAASLYFKQSVACPCDYRKFIST
jgi:hypothetical protein